MFVELRHRITKDSQLAGRTRQVYKLYTSWRATPFGSLYL
jgi:hypothetical protein